MRTNDGIRSGSSKTDSEAGVAPHKPEELNAPWTIGPGMAVSGADSGQARDDDTVSRSRAGLVDSSPEQKQIDAEARRRAFIRMTLIEDYRLSSAFIQVPKLAQILGVSPSTIWSHMRQRKFAIPYRMMNTTPMVCIDDLVEWYCERDDLIVPDEERAPRKTAKQEADDRRREREEETENIVANALASLGLPNTRKRTRST